MDRVIANGNNLKSISAFIFKIQYGQIYSVDYIGKTTVPVLFKIQYGQIYSFDFNKVYPQK